MNRIAGVVVGVALSSANALGQWLPACPSSSVTSCVPVGATQPILAVRGFAESFATMVLTPGFGENVRYHPSGAPVNIDLSWLWAVPGTTQQVRVFDQCAFAGVPGPQIPELWGYRRVAEADFPCWAPRNDIGPITILVDFVPAGDLPILNLLVAPPAANADGGQAASGQSTFPSSAAVSLDPAARSMRGVIVRAKTDAELIASGQGTTGRGLESERMQVAADLTKLTRLAGSVVGDIGVSGQNDTIVVGQVYRLQGGGVGGSAGTLHASVSASAADGTYSGLDPLNPRSIEFISLETGIAAPITALAPTGETGTYSINQVNVVGTASTTTGIKADIRAESGGITQVTSTGDMGTNLAPINIIARDGITRIRAEIAGQSAGGRGTTLDGFAARGVSGQC